MSLRAPEIDGRTQCELLASPSTRLGEPFLPRTADGRRGRRPLPMFHALPACHSGRFRHVVNLNECDARRAAAAGDLRGINSLHKREENRRIAAEVVQGKSADLHRRRVNRHGIIGHPVIVRGDLGASFPNTQERIRKHTRHSLPRERGTHSANENLLRKIARDHETADQHAFAHVVTTARTAPKNSELPGVLGAADLGSSTGAIRAAEAITAALGTPDIVVHNLGGSKAPGGGFAALTDELWLDEAMVSRLAEHGQTDEATARQNVLDSLGGGGFRSAALRGRGK